MSAPRCSECVDPAVRFWHGPEAPRELALCARHAPGFQPLPEVREVTLEEHLALVAVREVMSS